MKEIIVALATPFDESGKINYSALDAIVSHNLKQGADGLFVGGSAGEGMLLSLDEKIQLIKHLSKYNQTTKLIANVSSLGEYESTLLANVAESANYFAVASVVPYFYKHSMESIVLYYEAIIDATILPLIIYNFPENSGIHFDLDNENVKALFRNEHVLGVKHTNRDLYEMDKIMRMNPAIQMYNGYDEVYLNSLPLDVCGAIGSSFNITTEIFKRIGEYYEKGEMHLALEEQKRANEIMDALIKVGLIPGIKHALKHLGIDVGKPRLPFVELNEESKAYLEVVLNKHL